MYTFFSFFQMSSHPFLQREKSRLRQVKSLTHSHIINEVRQDFNQGCPTSELIYLISAVFFVRALFGDSLHTFILLGARHWELLWVEWRGTRRIRLLDSRNFVPWGTEARKSQNKQMNKITPMEESNRFHDRE